MLSSLRLRALSACCYLTCPMLGCGGDGAGTQSSTQAAVQAPADPRQASDGTLYCATAPLCLSTADLFVEGSSPYGTLQLADLSVDYLTGDTVGTRLTFTGSTDGRPFLFVVRLLSDLDVDGGERPVSPAGHYFAERATILRSLPDGTCAVDELEVDAMVLEHVAPSTPARGDRIVLGAKLLASGDGWKLDISVEARSACGTMRDG